MEHFDYTNLGNVMWKHIKQSPDKSHIDFTERPTYEILGNNIGLGMKLSVDESDLKEALAIVSKTTKEHALSGFRLETKPNQSGEAFSIYIARDEDHPEIIQSFVNRLEHRLRAANIKSGVDGSKLKQGCKPVQGSNYAYYHYGFTPNDYFQTPRDGDFMENIAVQKIAPRWYEKNDWRSIKDQETGIYNLCLDRVDTLSEVEQHNLSRFLRNNNVPYSVSDVIHRDKSTSQAIVIEMQSRDFLPLLAREEYQRDKVVQQTRQKAWGSRDSWRVVGGVALFDQIDKMTIRAQLALRKFLHSSHINCELAPIIHGDKSQSLTLQILDNPDNFFNKLDRYIKGRYYLNPSQGR